MYERGATLEMFLIETGAGYFYKRTTLKTSKMKLTYCKDVWETFLISHR